MYINNIKKKQIEVDIHGLLIVIWAVVLYHFYIIKFNAIMLSCFICIFHQLLLLHLSLLLQWVDPLMSCSAQQGEECTKNFLGTVQDFEWSFGCSFVNCGVKHASSYVTHFYVPLGVVAY